MPQAIVLFVATATGASALATAGSLTLLGNVIAGAIGLGINFALQALFAPKAPKPQEVKGVVRQSVPVRVKHYGQLRVGGKMIYIDTREGDLHQVVYVGQGPITSYEEFFLDDRKADPVAGGMYVGRTQHFFPLVQRLGTNDQLHIAELAAQIPAAWTVDHRARGCAIIYFECTGVRQKNFAKVYPNRIPVLNVVIKGCPVYDPRIGTTLWTDPLAAGANPGQNLPLILRQYLTDPDGMQINAKYIDDADFSAAANYADELISTKGGGTTRRYHGQFSYAFDNEPGDNVKRLLQAFAGRIYLKPTGKIGVHAGQWIAPTVHIPDDAISFYEMRDRSGPLRDANEVVVKYTAPLSRYSEATAQPWRDEADISEVGQIKTVPVEAYEVQSHNHARRLAKIEAHRRNPRWQGTIRTNLVGMQAWDQWIITVSISDLDINAESFEVLSIMLDDDTLTVTMEIASLTAAAFNFDPATEEGTAPVDPQDLAPETTDQPQNLAVTVQQRSINGDQKVAVLVATWTKPSKESFEAEAEHSIADANTWMPMEVNDDRTRAEQIGLEDGKLYDVRVRFVDAGGMIGNWSIVENVLVVADSTAPGDPTDLQATVTAGEVDFSVRAPNSGNVRSIIIKRGTTAQNYDAATLLDEQASGANQVISLANTPGAGTWRYWARAKNGSGVVSTGTPYIDVVVP